MEKDIRLEKENDREDREDREEYSFSNVGATVDTDEAIDSFPTLDKFCSKIDEDDESDEDEDGGEKIVDRSSLGDILFKIPIVPDPLIGTPKKMQKTLDKMALKIQKNPASVESERLYGKIHLYMHKYLISVALKQFPYIKGLQTVDVYQEALISLRFKAIPGFRKNKGMSFLNFAKLCIRRHLITILNASKNRQKDQTINRSISLDTPILSEDDNHNTLSNIIPDLNETVDKVTEAREALFVTKQKLMNGLSEFEKEVLTEYLSHASYKDIASIIVQRNVKKNKMSDRSKNEITDQKKIEKAVDNALLRIRKKAISMKNNDPESLPLFM